MSAAGSVFLGTGLSSCSPSWSSPLLCRTKQHGSTDPRNWVSQVGDKDYALLTPYRHLRGFFLSRCLIQSLKKCIPYSLSIGRRRRNLDQVDVHVQSWEHSALSSYLHGINHALKSSSPVPRKINFLSALVHSFLTSLHLISTKLHFDPSVLPSSRPLSPVSPGVVILLI